MKLTGRIFALFFAIVIAASAVSCTDAPLNGPETDFGVGRDDAGDSPATDAPGGTSADDPKNGDGGPTVDPNAPETRLSFLGCGDNIVYYGNVREAAATAGARTYNFAPTYEFVADRIKAADISFINQETLMCGEGFDLSYYPTFNGPQDMGLDLVDLGFDVVGMANNHMLDKGGAGLEACIRFWKSQPVLEIGGYTSEEDFTYKVYEKDGVNIAFLSYTYGTNGMVLYDGYEAWIPYLDEETVKKQVSAAKADPAVDLVFVSVHWGVEYQFQPSDEQKNYARIMTEAGADVIIGHHPHVIEPVEWLTASDGTKTLCIYSLGNFIGEQSNDFSMVGGMISFDIVKKGSAAWIEKPIFTPTVYYFNSNFYGNCIYLMTDFTEALAASHGIGPAYGNYTSLAKLRSYVTNCIAPEFLPDDFKAQVGLN